MEKVCGNINGVLHHVFKATGTRLEGGALSDSRRQSKVSSKPHTNFRVLRREKGQHLELPFSECKTPAAQRP